MIKADRLLTPLSFLAITAAVVILPAERSGWNFDSVISFLTAFATTVAIFAVITLGLNVQWGYTGVFNFGIAGFFMVGAYTAAIFTKPPAESEFVRYIGGFGDSLAFLPFLDSGQWLPFVFGTAAAALMSGALAFALSIPTLRLRADYLAITTIGIAELLRAVVLEERGLVNSARGLIGIPRPFHDFFEPDDYKFVYFGIAEEDDEWDEDGYVTEEELERTYSERPNVRRLTPRSRRQEFDDWTDPDADEQRTAVVRPRRRERRGEVAAMPVPTPVPGARFGKRSSRLARRSSRPRTRRARSPPPPAART